MSSVETIAVSQSTNKAITCLVCGHVMLEDHSMYIDSDLEGKQPREIYYGEIYCFMCKRICWLANIKSK
jgi:hypothetical protein